MADTFRALLVEKTDTGQAVRFADWTDADLMAGDVTVAVSHSTVNYKDGLAVTGKAPIIRTFPLVPGIDFAGTVTASDHSNWKPGDQVILNGWGVGETHHGGFAGRARVKGDWLVRLPQGMSQAQAMAIGTAGYTAMLCVLALEDQGVKPGDGEVLVTGAAGGVGSIGVIALHIDQSVKDANEGYRYTAVTAGTHKNDFSPHQPLTDEAKAELQAEVDRLYGLFVTHVAAMRRLEPRFVRSTQAGLYFGSDAVMAGLADAEGSFT